MQRTRQKHQRRQKAGRDAYNGGLLGLLTPREIFLMGVRSVDARQGHRNGTPQVLGIYPDGIDPFSHFHFGGFQGHWR